MKNSHLLHGKQAEHIACQLLQQHGLTLIAQNFRCRLGEIDLIMLDDDTLVFAEVRYRKCTRYGSALETVNQYKQNRIIKTAHCYLNQYRIWQKHHCRFDIVSLGQQKNIWLKHAFGAIH